MARTKAFNVEHTLQNAMRLFWRKGYSYTSISDLIATMGIQRGSLYGTYGNKDALFCRALEYYITHNWQDLQQDIANKSPLDAIEAMFIHPASASNYANASSGCFVINSIIEIEALDPNSKKVAQQCLERIGIFFEKRLKQAKFQTLIHPETDIKALATLLQSSYVGLRVISRIGTSSNLVPPVIKHILNQARI